MSASSGTGWRSSSRPLSSRRPESPGDAPWSRSPTGRAGTLCRRGSRSTGGSSAPSRPSRLRGPCSSSTAPTARVARKDRICRAETFDLVRRSRSVERIRVKYRSEVLWGELRPMPDGFQLVAIPGPDFLRRLLTAVLLLPAAGALYLLGGLIVLVRAIAARRRLRELLPPGARTFRGRLVALFVLTVMIPLLAVTFFLRSSITSLSRQDTVAHARTGLETARRVLDDYLPSAAATRGRLGLIDDALLSWLANAVGFDLSVYSPEAIWPRRPAAISTPRACSRARARLGLRGGRARRSAGDDRRAHSRRPAIPRAHDRAVGGSRRSRSPSPVLLSLLLLPQQRAAEAEAAQLTAAATAFALLVFLVSAAIAGRLAVRVARPVAGSRGRDPRGRPRRLLSAARRASGRGVPRARPGVSLHVPEPPRADDGPLARKGEARNAALAVDRGSRRVQPRPPGAPRQPRGRTAVGRPGEGATLDEVFPGDAMRPVREALARSGDGHVSEEIEPRRGSAGAS